MVGHRDPGSTACVVVAVLTHRRPKTLARLLSSFNALAWPDGSRVIVLAVDNDDNESARKIVEQRQSGNAEIRYVCESRRGIPIARNRALDEARAMDADLLCFIDDDEYPDRNWLAALVDCWRETGAHLIGGPVEVTQAPADAAVWSRFVNTSLIGRMKRKNRKTARAAETGRPFTVVTNNWLCDLNWQRRTGVRFNEKLLFSGGSDTAFHRAAMEAGARIAWCPSALVHETMSENRLTLAYQFRRAAAQSITHFRLKHAGVSPMIASRTLAIAAARFVLGAILVFVPVFGIASPVIAIRSLGWSTGRVKALLGRESELYKWSDAGTERSNGYSEMTESAATRLEG